MRTAKQQFRSHGPKRDSDLYETNLGIGFIKNCYEGSVVLFSNATMHKVTVGQAQAQGTNFNLYLAFEPLNKFYYGYDNMVAKLLRKQKTDG